MTRGEPQFLVDGTQLVAHRNFTLSELLGDIAIVQSLGRKQGTIALSSREPIQLVREVSALLGEALFFQGQKEGSF